MWPSFTTSIHQIFLCYLVLLLLKGGNIDSSSLKRRNREQSQAVLKKKLFQAQADWKTWVFVLTQTRRGASGTCPARFYKLQLLDLAQTLWFHHSQFQQSVRPAKNANMHHRWDKHTPLPSASWWPSFSLYLSSVHPSYMHQYLCMCWSRVTVSLFLCVFYVFSYLDLRVLFIFCY